jgi:hypothetical protein
MVNCCCATPSMRSGSARNNIDTPRKGHGIRPANVAHNLPMTAKKVAETEGFDWKPHANEKLKYLKSHMQVLSHIIPLLPRLTRAASFPQSKCPSLEWLWLNSQAPTRVRRLQFGWQVCLLCHKRADAQYRRRHRPTCGACL